MDAGRYAQIRDLFLAADELPKDKHESFVRAQAGDDDELAREVLELLGEHNAQAASFEGERFTAAEIGHAALADSAAGDNKQGARRRAQSVSGDSTLKWAQRTHAQPRHSQDSGRPEKPLDIRAPRVRGSRHRRSHWPLALVVLGALIPTWLVGWTIYNRATNLIGQSESAAVRSSIANVTSDLSEFLSQERLLAQTWSQDARVHDSILELVELARQSRDEPSPALSELLRAAPQAATIGAALRELSGYEETKFAVWNRAGNTLATWSPDRSDFGSPISMSMVEQLSHVMRGETVLYGPTILPTDIDGFVPDTTLPVMAVIVPVRNEAGRVNAALLIRGIDLYRRLNEVVDRNIQQAGGDLYLVNSNAVMVSDSRHARELAERGVIAAKPDELATRLRIADPGNDPSDDPLSRRYGQPLTNAAAGIVLRLNGESKEPYNNYAGESVTGAWRWLNEFQLGVIGERDFESANAPTRMIGWSFAGLSVLLSSLLLSVGYLQRSKSKSDERPDPLLQYEIGEPLGTGGMGVVFRAKHRHLGRPTALKVLRQDRQEPDDLLRFDREARVAAALDSPHIVTIYDYGRTAEGEFFTAMQLLRGLTLYEVVARSGPQPIGRVLFILRQVCDAIIGAHSVGLLHRDIKPQNIMLSLDASVGDWAVVFDFGLAKPLQPIKGMYQTSEAIWAGTPMYMAPERFRDPTVMDLRSDIYSLGCVAYFLLSGRPPFSECDPESLFALIISHEPISLQTHLSEPVPESIEQLVRRSMTKAASDRFASAQELADAIDALRGEFPWSTNQARSWWKLNGEELTE